MEQNSGKDYCDDQEIIICYLGLCLAHSRYSCDERQYPAVGFRVRLIWVKILTLPPTCSITIWLLVKLLTSLSGNYLYM